MFMFSKDVFNYVMLLPTGMKLADRCVGGNWFCVECFMKMSQSFSLSVLIFIFPSCRLCLGMNYDELVGPFSQMIILWWVDCLEGWSVSRLMASDV